MNKIVHLIWENNFIPFTWDWDNILQDDFGRIIWTCREKKLTPIRGGIDTQWRITEILCWSFHNCKWCINSVPTKLDTTDYDIVNPKKKKRA